MFVFDLATIITWWFILISFNLAGWFSFKYLFSNLSDQGYALIKIVGLGLTSYIVWLLASLHILPFSQLNSYVVFGFVIILNVISIFWNRNSLVIPKKIVRIILFEEFLFLVGMIFWTTIRGFNPSIHGLEKFMDFSIINSILRSNYFPPLDPWLSGNTVNYYYFGHFITALLIKISAIKPEIAFNLMLGTIFGLTISGSFSIGYNLFSLASKNENIKKSLIVGLLAAFLVTLSGNLHTVYVFTKGYEIGDATARPPWELLGKFNLQDYWYPSAVRFIPYAIHEIPSYSFIVSDLHAHLLDIPFVLTIISVILSIGLRLKSLSEKRSSFLKILAEVTPQLFLLSILISLSYMINSVDGAIYTILFFIVSIAIFYRIQYGWLKSFLFSLAFIAIIAVINFLFTYPFSSHFVPFVNGIGVNCGENIGKFLGINHLGPLFFDVNKCQSSPSYMLFIIWGFPLFVGVFYALSLWKNRKINFVDIFLLGGGLLSWLLILFPEFFYLRDIYPMHFRANTMFKFGYQAFILLSIISAIAIFRTQISNRIIRTGYIIFLLLQLFLVGIYPIFGIRSYYQELNNYQGLDGNNYWSIASPSDLAAINWLQKNIKDQPTIIEASGEAYSDYVRISSFTGLPTIIGWPGHEWGWHQSGNEAYRRVSEVHKFYESDDSIVQQEIIKKYNVKFVIVGEKEKIAYPKLKSEAISKLGKKVYEFEDLVIYEITK